MKPEVDCTSAQRCPDFCWFQQITPDWTCFTNRFRNYSDWIRIGEGQDCQRIFPERRCSKYIFPPIWTTKMLLGTLQICNEELRAEEIREICDSLNDNSIRSLSLRGCKVHDDDFKKLMESLKECESLAQLNLNLGVCNGRHRIKWLSEALAVNKCLSSLL